MTIGRPTFGYASIVAVGLALALGVRVEAAREFETAREHYVEARRADANVVARQVQDAIRSIYENIRTLALLPSVRKLDRHGSNLVADGRAAIQQVYNNLANSVSVSEVYFVPVTLDPEKIDPVTGAPEAPILMFDQLIVDAGRFANDADPFAAHVAEDTGTPEVPEVEIYEYDQLVEQLSWLKQHYPTGNAIHGLAVPMIGGPEIITCDNTTFVSTGVDADRSGVIFSVPFYGPDEKLSGSVSAIILSDALRALLPEQNFALVNSGYHYASRPSEAGQERASAEWVAKARPDPGLIYSEVIPLADNDPRSRWAIWVGYPDFAFFQGAEAKAARYFEISGYGVAGLLTLAGLVCWALIWPKPLKVAVNLSPVQFKNQALTHSVVLALDRSGLAPSRLELEITESVLLAANESTMHTLHHLRGLGVKIAMDDFGTGYSSLSYLRSFPFDKIKIDQSFVREISDTEDSIAIIRAVAALGISLGVTTTAEGVETAEQLERIRQQGCAEVQGFYFSRPVPNAEVADLLRKRFAAVA